MNIKILCLLKTTLNRQPPLKTCVKLYITVYTVGRVDYIITADNLYK